MKELQDSETIPAIAPDIAALLDLEREVPPMSEDTKDRAFARAAAALLVATEGRTTPQRRSLVRPRFVAAAAITLLIAAAGAAAFQMQQRTAPPPASPVAPAVHPASQAPAPSVDSVAPAPSVESPRAVARPNRRAPQRQHVSPDELPLLRKAREAVGRGGFAEAMDMLREHEARFPTSRFGEERDALKVRSLSGLGRLDEAHREAKAFRSHFPHSVLLPRMNDAIPSERP